MPEQHQGSDAFFADKDIGLDALKYVLEHYHSHVKCVVTMNDNEIAMLAKSMGAQVFHYDEITAQNVNKIFLGVDIIFLLWWPKIIPDFIINVPKVGVVNFHPSLLPYNRGKNYNFWTIVEDTPFGVTLNFVDGGIDSGDILFQSPIKKSWEDTGGTLYLKARKEMLLLFQARYLDIIEGRYKRIPQDKTLGQLHFSKELDPASQVYLDKDYCCRDLLNLLRARTFEGKPACYFFEGDKKYEVRVSITEVNNERK